MKKSNKPLKVLLIHQLAIKKASFYNLVTQVSTVLSVILMTLTFVVITQAQTPDPQFVQGFETDNSGWLSPTPTRVASGTNGITSKTGTFHAQATTSFTRWGGYNTTFPTRGYTTSVDIYLNVSGANDTRFDFTSAINTNNPTPTHRRDFAFNAGYYDDAVAPGSGPRFVVSASNNTGRANSFPKNPGRDPFIISASGWYTFKHKFYDNGSGVLAVDLSIIDSSNVTIKTWTLSDPSDVIATTIGGNRYGWFANNEFAFLAIDDSQRSNLIEQFNVDDDGMASASDCDAGDPAFMTIQAAINDANTLPGDLVRVCPGTYIEDVLINKAGLRVIGSGAASTTISGPIGGDGATVRFGANNLTVAHFTITRQGNNTTDWNNAGLNSAGVAIQGLQLPMRLSATTLLRECEPLLTLITATVTRSVTM